MEAKDLRIGNYVQLYGKQVQVLEIWDTALKTTDINTNCAYFIDQYSSIPLTEEILLKCGFEKYGEYHYSYKNNPFIIDLSILGEFYYFRKMINANESILLKEIKYLHQIQNLYHSLTGKELAYNE